MSERIETQDIIGTLFPLIKDKISELKENNKWAQLFVDTGEFLQGNDSCKEKFLDDLIDVFSEKNMKKLAANLKGTSGYSLKDALCHSINTLLLNYEIEPYKIDELTNHFLQVVLKYLERNIPEKYNEYFLNEWREEAKQDASEIKEQQSMIISLLKSIGGEKREIFSVSEINAELWNMTKEPKLDLNFFNIDDEEFQNKFHQNLGNERVYVVGKSKEETIYCILNELIKNGFDKRTLIVKSENAWKALEKEDISDKILIPCFYADHICTISGNTNIFIYGEDEPCPYKDRIVLRRRTKDTVQHALRNAGYSASDAEYLVEETHGLYIPLKKYIFDGAIYNENQNLESLNHDVLIAVLLCGQWEEYDGDKDVLQALSGENYEKIMDELRPAMLGENPFIMEVNGRNGKSLQVTSIGDAWEEFDGFVSDVAWNKFIALLYETMEQPEPIFEYPTQEQYIAGIITEKPNRSGTLKHGMIRTLIMKGYYLGNKNAQYQVDQIVQEILSKVKSEKDWAKMSQYFCDLCEASPVAVTKRLKDEISHPSGMMDLFAENPGDGLKGRYYYTEILWAIEQLLLQNQYVYDAIEILWQMNEIDIEYKISNSPKSTLEMVFCAWLNLSAITVTDKIQLAGKAIKKYKNAWDVFYSELPGVNSTVFGGLNSPKYRDIDRGTDLSNEEISHTYMEYIKICVDYAEGSADRWVKIIGSMDELNENLIHFIFDQLLKDLNQMNDKNLIAIKDKIRSEIYRNRFYANSDWAMDEGILSIYEETLSKIHTVDPVFEYLYLFDESYDFPLLHPVPFENKTDSLKKNQELIDLEIQQGIEDFKNKSYSLLKLLTLADEKKSRTAGEIIAKYYDNNVFQPETIKIMQIVNPQGRLIKQYVAYFAAGGYNNAIIDTLNIIGREDINLVADLLSLEQISNREEPLVNNENDKVKELFWRKTKIGSLQKNVEVYRWAISECKNYGTVQVYIELLFEAKELFTTEELLIALAKIDKVKSEQITDSSMTDYYLKEILKPLQKKYMSDNEKRNSLARVEFYARNLLDWGDMLCLQYVMKESPDIYAKLIDIIYSKDGTTEETSPEEKKQAAALFDFYCKAKFCPAEFQGKVRYDNLKKWSDDFHTKLSDQKQLSLFGNLMGRILANSPVGEDNYMPCEAVRQLIEEIYDEELKLSYVIAEKNSRGIYTPDAGKTEKAKANAYKENANHIRREYPHSAEIYDELSAEYEMDSERERKRAEDEW